VGRHHNPIGVEPPRRRDGTCAAWNCGRPLVDPSKVHGRVAEDLAEDPFCSVECANAHFRVPWGHSPKWSHTPSEQGRRSLDRVMVRSRVRAGSRAEARTAAAHATRARAA